MAEPYEIADKVPSPRLPGEVVVREEVADLIDAIAADLLVQAKACVRAFGDFHLALSGGSTPEPLYRRLMYDPRLRQFPWKKTHLWQVDERCVAEDDAQRNWGMISEILLDHSDIPAEQAHPMPVLEPDGDTRYEAELREALEWREKGHDRLDFVLLGMGSDLHTASLFPGSVALEARAGRLVVFNEGPGVVPPRRMTMTFEMLNAARFVAVMVTGEAKREAIGRLVGGGLDRMTAPIRGIEPVGGALRWYLDRKACPEGG
ncbi:6-phosphogluconolactonase, eukaryotic type [hydrothermal vent metagenome]|uniref:6-phosphogluconolactonase, eukaryotic type n=1 Tax=hydrothermal vent metagenome TaxID=652676 RepID=A0A3B1DYZ0_9ZZZZ